MPWQLIALDATAPVPWRNGGGTTRELLVWPDPQDWDGRISVAEVATNGPFSRFDGVQRWFAVLSGAGVRLALDGRTHVLTARSAPLCFDGAQPCACELIDGPTQDFNLMVRSGRADARMTRVAGALAVTVAPGTGVAVYASDEPVLVQLDDELITVAPRTLAWGAFPSGGLAQVRAATALWMEILPTTPDSTAAPILFATARKT